MDDWNVYPPIPPQNTKTPQTQVVQYNIKKAYRTKMTDGFSRWSKEPTLSFFQAKYSLTIWAFTDASCSLSFDILILTRQATLTSDMDISCRFNFYISLLRKNDNILVKNEIPCTL